jgi:hypothetical protein
MTTATAMDKFQAAYDAMIESCNFPNLKRVVIKPKGATAEHDMTLTGDPTKDIDALRAAVASGDKVIVHYAIRKEPATHVYNRPTRQAPKSNKRDHAVKGALSWNNAGSYLVRYHESKKSLQVLPLKKQVSGHELGRFLTDLHANKGVRRAMVDDTILSDAQLGKIEAYVNGEAAPKVTAAPPVPSVAHKNDLQIVKFDDKLTPINKYRWVYFMVKGGLQTTFDQTVMDAILAATGAKLSRFHAKEMFVIRTPQNREPITQDALQAILNLNAVVNATPDAAPAAPAAPAPVVTPAAPAAPAATPDAALIAAIVAQVMAAMQPK